MAYPTIALKVVVDTYRGTRDGVPRLVQTLQDEGADATFLFSVGPDHTGRAIKRVFRSGFLSKVRRTSVMSHYGLPTLLYGTVWPGPDIGKQAAGVMRVAQTAGFEVGVHSFDHVAWQDKVGDADAAWTEEHMQAACDRFTEIFGEAPHVHGAAGWQMNRNAYRLTQRLGFDYCSDTRGTHPFIPVYQAEIVACPQLPTTLPTLDELIGRDGIEVGNVADHLFAITQDVPKTGHVFTLHAELEGMKLMPVFQRLLQGWKAQGYQLASLRQYFASLPGHDLPRHEVTLGEVPGRSGTLAMQGREFLALSS